MPLIRNFLGPATRPAWSTVTSAGIFRVPAVNGRFDCHYHDCNEYWLFFAGKGKATSEGQTFYIKAGDILATRAGDEHDIIEVYETLEAFWFEDATPAGGKVGHLHRSPEKAKGHAVPHLPLPPDFPT